MTKFSRKETYDRIDDLVNSKKSWEDIVKVLNKEGHSTNRIQPGKWTVKNSYDFYRRISPERPSGVRKVQQERRIEMCKLLNSGKTIKEIAAKFNICDMSVRSAIKTALRKNEAVINSNTRFGKRRKSTKRKQKSLAIAKTNFPSSAISEMKSVLESVLESNMDSGSKLVVIKTILGQK
jgi:DNA-binding CsgD family transcriptional regulator